MRRATALLVVLLVSPAAQAQVMPWPSRESDDEPIAGLLRGGTGVDSLTGNITTARGNAVSLTRATAATYTRRGQVVLAASGGHRPQEPGLLAEIAATNNLLRSREFSHAAWTASGLTVSSPTNGGRDGTTIANRLTATAPAATLSQALTLAAATRTSALDVRRVTGSGALEFTRDGGSTWTALSASNCRNDEYVLTAPNASGWVRCEVSSSVLDPLIALRLATQGDVVDVDFAQDEAGSSGSSRIIAAGTAGVRNADSYAIPTTGWPTAAGRMRFRFSSNYAISGGLGYASPIVLFHSAATNPFDSTIFSDGTIRFRIGNGSTSTSATSAAQAWVRGRTYLMEYRWGGGTTQLFRDHVLLVTGTSQAMPTAWTTAFSPGCYPANLGLNINGIFSDLEVRP